MQIRKHILNILSDGLEHNTTEIADYIKKNNIKLDKSSTTIRNILYHLKNENNSIINPRRGVYQMINAKTSPAEDELRQLNDAITIIKTNLSKCKDFN